jgi:pyruvate-formate lyase-activating enzyme
MTWLLALLPNLLRWGLIASMAAAAGYVVYAYNDALRDAERLQGELDKAKIVRVQLEEQVKGLETNVTQREEAMEALIKDKDLWAKDLKEACEAYGKISEDDPDPIGSVLERLKEKENAQ